MPCPASGAGQAAESRDYSLRFFIVVMMAISSLDSASRGNVSAGSTPHSSRRSSSQRIDSSASCNAPPSFDTNAAFDRALDASLMCAATEVPERRSCLPTTRASSRALGSFTYNRIISAAYFLVRILNSSLNRPAIYPPFRLYFSLYFDFRLSTLPITPR